MEINQCVDGVEDDATIHPGKLAPALSLATSKRVHWFPKLTCAVGDRAWAYDGKKRCINQISRCPVTTVDLLVICHRRDRAHL